MIYEKQNFIDYPLEGYTTLKAEHLNHIESGIDSISSIFPSMTANDFGKQLFVNEAGDGFLLIGNTKTIKWENLTEEAELARPGYIAGKGLAIGTENERYQAASSFYTYINIPVKEGVTYYFGEPEIINGNYARFVNWQSDKYTGLSTSGTITSMTNAEIAAATISMINGLGKTEAWTAPAGAKYCTVSFYDTSQGGTDLNYVTTIANPEDRVDKTYNESIEIVESGKWNIIEEAEVTSNNWFSAKKTGGTHQGGGFYTAYNIPIIGGKTYYLGPAFNNQYARFINWSSKPYTVDSNGTVSMSDTEIASITVSASQATTSEAHFAPKNAKYCTISFYVGYGGIVVDECYFTTIEKIEERVDGKPTYRVNTQGVSSETLQQIEQNTANIQQIQSDILRNNKVEPFSFIQRTRKPIIDFQFDDGLVAGDSICKGIFDEYGYKCDFAITSGISAQGVEVYLNFQKEGFHILSHSTDGAGMGSVTDEADKTFKINKMKESYRILKSKGFDIHGWVTPSSGLHDSLYEPLAEIYDYGFGTGQTTSPYHKFGTVKYLAHMQRVGIESNLILKGEANTSGRTKVITYTSDFWGVTATPDENYELLYINNAPLAALENATSDGYSNLLTDNTVNEEGLKYLLEIWGVSKEDGTLVVDSENGTISLTPTFKICCEREGMRNIRNYIDNAISQNAFLAFYAHNSYSEENGLNGYGINLSKYTREILNYCQKTGVKVMNAKEGVQEYFSFRYTDFLELKEANV